MTAPVLPADIVLIGLALVIIAAMACSRPSPAFVFVAFVAAVVLAVLIVPDVWEPHG